MQRPSPAVSSPRTVADASGGPLDRIDVTSWIAGPENVTRTALDYLPGYWVGYVHVDACGNHILVDVGGPS